MKRDKIHIYNFIALQYFLNKTRRAIVHGIMIGRT
jgi:hypothetical protein